MSAGKRIHDTLEELAKQVEEVSDMREVVIRTQLQVVDLFAKVKALEFVLADTSKFKPIMPKVPREWDSTQGPPPVGTWVHFDGGYAYRVEEHNGVTGVRAYAHDGEMMDAKRRCFYSPGLFKWEHAIPCPPPAGFKPEPEPCPFKVGQEVELHDITSAHKDAEGKRGRVTCLDKSGEWPVWVEVDGAYESHCFRVDEVRLYVPPAQKFKAGDWVRVTASCYHHRRLDGKALEIRSPRRVADFYTVMERDKGHEWVFEVLESDLEPYAPAPSDKVVVTLKDGRGTVRGEYLSHSGFDVLLMGSTRDMHRAIVIPVQCVLSIEPDVAGGK